MSDRGVGTTDSKDALLAKAAAAAEPMPGVGDMANYLHAYYRHVEVEDLGAAGPDRIAAVALRQAQLAVSRPQGRALVDVRPGGSAALDATSYVIDIVTDDMPFLVDSITMELGNHGLSARLVIHPQLRVRRDVTGALRDVVGTASAGQVNAERTQPRGASRVLDAHRDPDASRRRGRGHRR